MTNIKHVFSIFLTIFLIGCSSTQVLKQSPFAIWDESFVQTFDKAQGVNVTFTANSIDNVEPRIEFRGNTYRPIEKSSITKGNQIKKYQVNIPGPIEQGEYRVTLKHGSGEEEITDELSLKVYPSRLQTIKLEDEDIEFSLEDELVGLTKSLSKGDALEFNVLPSSGTSIPLNQFRILTKGFTKSSPILGTSVASYNGYNVPFDADKVGVKLIWIDPSDQENIVQIAPTDGSEFIETVPGLKRPRIVCGDITRITDENNPVFMISCEVKAPVYADINTSISDVIIEIRETSVKGYKVTTIGQPQLLNGKWTMGFKLVGTLPIPKGTGGSIKISIKAAAMAPNGEKSSISSRTCRFNVVY
jgi:hypothetical protein